MSTVIGGNILGKPREVDVRQVQRILSPDEQGTYQRSHVVTGFKNLRDKGYEEGCKDLLRILSLDKLTGLKENWPQIVDGARDIVLGKKTLKDVLAELNKPPLESKNNNQSVVIYPKKDQAVTVQKEIKATDIKLDQARFTQPITEEGITVEYVDDKHVKIVMPTKEDYKGGKKVVVELPVIKTVTENGAEKQVAKRLNLIIGVGGRPKVTRTERTPKEPDDNKDNDDDGKLSPITVTEGKKKGDKFKVSAADGVTFHEDNKGDKIGKLFKIVSVAKDGKSLTVEQTENWGDNDKEVKGTLVAKKSSKKTEVDLIIKNPNAPKAEEGEQKSWWWAGIPIALGLLGGIGTLVLGGGENKGQGFFAAILFGIAGLALGGKTKAIQDLVGGSNEAATASA